MSNDIAISHAHLDTYALLKMKKNPVGFSSASSRCFVLSSARRCLRHLTVVSFLRGGTTISTGTKKPQAKPLSDVRLQLDTRTLIESREGGRQMNDQTRSHKISGQPVTFSSATLRAREKVLDIVMANISGRSVDAVGSTDMVELVLQGRGVADFAAALSLLLECGQQESQVIAAGTAFLKESQNSISATAPPAPLLHREALPDVALCVALAHHRLATSLVGGLGMLHADLKPGVRGAGPLLDEKAFETAYDHIISGLKVTKEWLGDRPANTAERDAVASNVCLVETQSNLVELLMVRYFCVSPLTCILTKSHLDC